MKVSAEPFATTASSLGSYLRVFDNLIARSDVHVLQVEEPDPRGAAAIRAITYNDILIAAKILRSNPTLTLDEAAEQLWARLGTTCSARQPRLTMRVSVRAMFMIDCTGPVDGWLPNERFDDLASRVFPRALAISTAAKEAMNDRKSMKAWKLKARFRLHCRGTDNLARHLLLDLSHPDGADPVYRSLYWLSQGPTGPWEARRSLQGS
ncbi:uncharacterized protein B0T15DRAFT_325805 [Chaetomium strumarium]|uniref:Uncharacterized protein n=1 Tax=Chaetomium strumarium TaxID=1170767 RepID=A0AAJ0GKZ6_9PEZI|nr:hypothetical protein B0T15DRAFT_325805 [Chaetomium strumarium]